MSARAVQLFCYLGSLLLFGCGGGGGGYGGGGGGGSPTVTGKGFAPSTGPGDTAGYFPVGAGDQWEFNYSTTDPKASAATGVVTLAVNGTKTVLGATATVLTQTNSTSPSGGFDEYFGVSPGGVTNLGNTNAGDPITPLIVPYVQLLFPVQLGMQSSLTGQNLPAGNDASGHAITLDMTQTTANSSIESVDVPAGSYANALKQVTTINGTAHDNGQSGAVTGTETTWLVPGIGIVKDTNSAMSVAQTISSSAELRSATVNGQTHGLGVARDLVAVSPAMASIYAPAVPVIASDGTNFLIVTPRASVSGGVSQQNWQGTLVAADGTVLSSFNITAPVSATTSCSARPFAVAGFDGTNYLVVSANNHCATFQPTTLDAVAISPAGAIVAGPNTVASPAGPSEGTGTFYQALGFDGSQYLLVYVQPVVTGNQLYGVFIAPATAQANGAAFPIAPDTGPQDSPAMAYDGTNYLVAWDEEPGLLEAVRVSAAGAVLDATPIGIAHQSSPCCGYMSPSVSFDGTNYLVTYRDPRGQGGSSFNAAVSAARISKAGVLLDGTLAAAGIVVTSAPGVPLGHVASVFRDGAHWIVWESGTPNALSASRVSPAGLVPSAWQNGFPLVPATGEVSSPAIAAGGSAGYVTWLHGQGTSPETTSLAGLAVFP